jgi:uncharacterized membrane protein YkvA (DUF1232 family)
MEKPIDFTERMTKELHDYIQGQAALISISDIKGLLSDLPAMEVRIAQISSRVYPYLADQLAFLALVMSDAVTDPFSDPSSPAAGEAAFALLYFQRTTDLIPDSMPGMGLLDDAIIVGIVLRRNEETYRRSRHADKLRWPAPKFDVDQLLSVISPLRLKSFYSSNPVQTRLTLT